MTAHYSKYYRHFYLLLICSMLVGVNITAQSIKGKVIDATSGEVLVGASVTLKTTPAKIARTGLDGSFNFKNLSVGNFAFNISFVGYENYKGTAITETAGSAGAMFIVKMKTLKTNLSEITVTGSKTKESDEFARRTELNANTIVNIVSAKAIEISPDITLGNVIQRISGVSVTRTNNGDGQFATIRGMSPRYSYTSIGSVILPSPDDKNRSVPMDIFPADMIERVEVVKDLSTSIEGSAIAGVTNLVMKNAPSKLVVNGNISTAIGIGNGTQGTFAFNLIIGSATNAIKVSNGKGVLSQSNIICYNNTILNGGYRRFLYGGAGNSLGRGASFDYESGAAGSMYNNLLVDNRFGLRIVGNSSYFGNNLVIADTAYCRYGYNFNYGDDPEITNQFYPTAFLTIPQTTDIPAPNNFLSEGYTLGMVYDGTALVGKNNPQFIHYSLPVPYSGVPADAKLATISFVGNYDFHLKSTSPCIGKGTSNFKLLNVVPVDPIYGATELTTPGMDIGCYQVNGSGNKH